MPEPGANLLIVDDSRDNRAVLARYAQRLGHRTSEAADGAEALAAIARDRPDLVLMDLVMPNVDGFAVLERLRSDGGPFLPVIVVSAATEREHRLRALGEGAHEFIGKPIDPDELAVRVRTLLALKASQDELARQADALRRHNARVEEIVLERTAELQLANKQLVAADRYKDEFLSVVSHELRTPLTSMIGYGSILHSGIAGPLGRQQAEFVEEMVGSANRLLRLVNTLLDFAKIKAGRLELAPQPTLLGELIGEVVHSLRPLMADKGLHLTTGAALATPIRLDRLRVGQVLTNMIGNAIKFTPEGGRIDIEVAHEETQVVVRIRDTGVGFDGAQCAQLFTPFRQLNMSTTREAEGTGLGLSISQALVESHGGAIGATSPGPGQGATFWFTLPARGEPAA